MNEITLKVNGETFFLVVDGSRTLLDCLREDLHLTGTKKGCDRGDCGVCTVLADGLPVNACLVLAAEMQGKEITTIEGVATHGSLHPLQQAFIDHGAIQCGFCTPGMVLSAKALLDTNPKPTEEEIKNTLAGNLCRCGSYQRIVKAILSVADKLALR
jgi:carbon-monoxide dehydrogenase small subunit